MAASDDAPYVEIKQVGRWTYTVKGCHGIGQWGPNGGAWFVHGKRRAERKARRVLAAYMRNERLRAQPPIVITRREVEEMDDKILD